MDWQAYIPNIWYCIADRLTVNVWHHQWLHSGFVTEGGFVSHWYKYSLFTWLITDAARINSDYWGINVFFYIVVHYSELWFLHHFLLTSHFFFTVLPVTSSLGCHCCNFLHLQDLQLFHCGIDDLSLFRTFLCCSRS